MFKELPLDPDSIRNIVDIRTNIFSEIVNSLADKLFTGELSIGAWQEAMKSEIRSLHTGMAAIGKGGWGDMTKSDWGRVGAEVKKQYRYLQGFADDIMTNADTISLNQVSSRARLYQEAARHTAYIMQADKDLLIHLPWIPKDGSTECLVGCKCTWELDVLNHNKKNNTKSVKAVWKLHPAEHCNTCIERNNYTTTFDVSEDIDVPNMIGGY